MGRDPDLWDDPLVFHPGRWIPFKQPDPYAFPVFQAGPRICLGMNMALFEASLLTVVLLRRYRFAPGAGALERTYKFGLTMGIKDGFSVIPSMAQH